MSGHLFIINGDLTKVACDAILIPTDERFKIEMPRWRALLRPDHQVEVALLRRNTLESWRSKNVLPLNRLA